MPNKSISHSAIDALARRWEQIEALEDRLADKRDRLKDSILRAINEHGEVATNAKTMRVLRGIAREIQATFPVETNVNPAAARKFLQECPRALGRRVFQRSEKFSLRPGAYGVAMTAIGTERLARLFHLAVERHDGAPRVKVVKLKKQRKAA